MRKIALCILFFTMLLTLAACAGQIRESQLNSISVGMTKEQVVKILGHPQNVTISGKSEIYRYFVKYVHSWRNLEMYDYYDLYFSDGKLTKYSVAGQETISTPRRFPPVRMIP